jgi:hypothetical protein
MARVKQVHGTPIDNLPIGKPMVLGSSPVTFVAGDNYQCQIPLEVIGTMAKSLGFKPPPNWKRTLKTAGASTPKRGRKSPRVAQRSTRSNAGRSAAAGA